MCWRPLGSWHDGWCGIRLLCRFLPACLWPAWRCPGLCHMSSVSAWRSYLVRIFWRNVLNSMELWALDCNNNTSVSSELRTDVLHKHLKPEVLNCSLRAPPPPLCIFCMSLFVNTPDSDNQLVRSALHAWTVFRLTCSLHRVHCSLLPEQGKSAEVYFISEHSFMDWAAQRLHARTSVTSYTSVNIYNFNSRLAHFNALWMEYIRSLRTGIMAEYPVMSTSQGTCVRIEQTSEAIRVTYEICRAGGGGGGVVRGLELRNAALN